jgi:prepilin-type N-terminal cleavage/methylation domain-containing protein
MKQSMFSKQGQKGFTLLELLIVVTIIAILSVGAILAYEGLTDQAQAATAANNTAGADQAIRNFRAVTGNYPNQWDHLVANDAGGSALNFVADETYQVLASVDATAISAALIEAFDRVGIEELQARIVDTTEPGVEPNLQHSEGAVSNGNTIEIELEDGEFPTRLVVIPTATGFPGASTACTVAGNAMTEIRATDADGDPIDSNVDDPAVAQAYMTTINDNIGEDECHLVVALGFGHDAAHSTVNSNVAIAAAPAFVSNNIKPADNYARYIALFDVGVDGNNGGTVDQSITADELYLRPKMIGLIDPEGRVIDQNVAAANDTETAN